MFCHSAVNVRLKFAVTFLECNLLCYLQILETTYYSEVRRRALTLHKLKIINDALPRALVTLTIAKLMNEPGVENNF